MPIVVTSAKGQVVIPKEERDKVGIGPGTRVVVTAVDDHIEVRPIPGRSLAHQSPPGGSAKGAGS
jgi:AbrB family looped-hinge helix DNA binding protein